MYLCRSVLLICAGALLWSGMHSLLDWFSVIPEQNGCPDDQINSLAMALALRGRVAQDRLEILQIYRLLQTVHDRDWAHIEKMVCLGVPDLINLTEPTEGRAALHLASTANDTAMVSFLLAQGAHSNVQDREGRTPVMLAAELGHDAVMVLLAERQADMNVLDNEGKGVLSYCISPTEHHMRCLQVALSGEADVSNVSAAGKPVFLLACENAHKCGDMCLEILERGADPNAFHQVTERTALMEACGTGALDLVRAILQRGGNPHALDKKKMNAVHMAAHGGFFEVIVLLSAYSADLGAVALNLSNALHVAAAGGFAECCRFLAQRGCSAKQKNSEGLLPRQVAKDKATIKELKKAERLQGKLTKPDAVDPNEPWKLTLHDWSLEHQDLLRSTMESLEDAEGPVETVTVDTFVTAMKDHNVPLDDEQLQKIVEEHDPEHQDRINMADFFKGLCYLLKSFTLPSYAPKAKKARKGGKKGRKKGKSVLPLPICVLPPDLLHRQRIETYQHFTDTSRFNRKHPPCHPIEDDSAWYLDKPEKVFTEISQRVRLSDLASLSLAFSQGVPVDVQGRYYNTPLMTACRSANLEVAEFLVGLGADVNACDQFSWTPLHLACLTGQTDIAKLLVNSGATVDAESANGATPLMRAIESCRLGCVGYLIEAGANVQAQNKQGQNCLAIAQAYGDPRITELVQDQLDRPLKPKQEMEKGRGNAEEAKLTLPPLSKKTLTEHIITINNTHTTSRVARTQDISYTPRTVWGKQLLVEDSAELRGSG